MYENFRAITACDEAKTFALVVPFDRTSLPTGERQNMATPRAMLRLRRISLLLPTCLHEGDATILADEVTIGGEKVNEGRKRFGR